MVNCGKEKGQKKLSYVMKLTRIWKKMEASVIGKTKRE